MSNGDLEIRKVWENSNLMAKVPHNSFLNVIHDINEDILQVVISISFGDSSFRVNFFCWGGGG